MALAQQEQRSLLCDAAGGDVALHCRLEQRHTLADALAEKRSLAEALQSGPAGVQVLAGIQELLRRQEAAGHAWDRWMAQLEALLPRPDVVVIDAGSRPDPLARQLWQAADRLLLVITAETAAIMDAYAAIKLLTDRARPSSLALLVNRAPEESLADEAHERLERACRRFLGLPLPSVGYVPEDGAVPPCAARGEPLVLALPACPASVHLQHVALAMGCGASARQQTPLEEAAVLSAP